MNFRSLLSRIRRFPVVSRCPNLAPRPKPRNNAEPAAPGQSRGPRFLRSRSPVGWIPTLRRISGGLSKAGLLLETGCHSHKRLAAMRVAPHHSTRFPGGRLPKDQDLSNPSGLRPPSNCKGIDRHDLLPPETILAFRALRRVFAHDSCTPRKPPSTTHPLFRLPAARELHACHTRPVQSTT